MPKIIDTELIIGCFELFNIGVNVFGNGNRIE
jgi:hypothetical protein